jgi:hypothetical protein
MAQVYVYNSKLLLLLLLLISSLST